MPTNKPKAESVQSLSVNKTIAIAAMGTLIVVLLCGFAAKTLISFIGFNGRVIDKKNTANEQLKANLPAVTALAASYVELGSKLQLINDALPTTPDFPSVVSTIEAIAGSSGVRLKSVTTANTTPVAAVTSTVPQSFEFSVSVAGSYDNLLKFFSNIELSSRPMKLLGLTQTGSSSAQSADLKLQTYYQAAVDTTPKSEVIK